MRPMSRLGVLVMAYGTASGPDDIERYYTDIRGGRAPSPERLAELRDRYAAIGDVYPLLETTRAQADGLVRLRPLVPMSQGRHFRGCGCTRAQPQVTQWDCDVGHNLSQPVPFLYSNLITPMSETSLHDD